MSVEGIVNEHLTVIVVAFFGMLTSTIPFFIAKQQNSSAANIIEAANKRADELYQREIARAEAVARAAERVRLTLEANTESTSSKLDAQHFLINSLYTASKKSELRAVMTSLTALQDNAELRRAAGQSPSPENIAQIVKLQTDMENLRKEIEDRAAADAAAKAALAPAVGSAVAVVKSAEVTVESAKSTVEQVKTVPPTDEAALAVAEATVEAAQSTLEKAKAIAPPPLDETPKSE